MANELAIRLQNYLAQARALRDTMMFIYQSDGSNVWRFGSFKTFAQKYNALAGAATRDLSSTGILSAFDLDKMGSPYDTIALTQKNNFDTILANVGLLISLLEQALGTRASEVEHLRDFFQANLRRAVFDVPSRERDVQNTVEQLLIGRGMQKGVDYDRETGRVKVSAKEVIPDFILPKLGLAIEVKLIKDPAHRGPLIDEINADIQAYGKSYANILFIIYDLGVIRDEAEFKQDLDNADNVLVVVVKH